METVPRIVKVGGAFGFLGGLVSIICLAIFFEADEHVLVDMGAYMLFAVMFFALAGGFAKGGQWQWDILLLMAFLTIGAVGCAVVFGAVDLYAGVILVLIGALIVVSLTVPSSKNWANRMRV